MGIIDLFILISSDLQIFMKLSALFIMLTRKFMEDVGQQIAIASQSDQDKK